MPDFAPALLSRPLAFVEKVAGYLLGKGYGTSSLEREVGLALSLHGGEPSLVVDVGGNVGEYPAEIRRRCPGARVHVFEPAATNIARLRQRFGADPALIVNPVALADSDGEAFLHADEPGSGMASLAKRDISHVGRSFEHREAIRTMRFERYWRESLAGAPLDIV